MIRQLDKGELNAIKESLANALAVLEYDNIVEPQGARKKVIAQVRDTLKHVFGPKFNEQREAE